MTLNIICCGVLKKELEHALENINSERLCRVSYLEVALHLDMEKLVNTVDARLKEKRSESTLLLLGTQCHPELKEIASAHGVCLPPAGNCFEMLLGDKKPSLDQEASTFYLTPGWLENWRLIFMEGLGWDSIDARQNFGLYERILLLDTGVSPIEDEDVLEFFDYTQVPVETMPVELDHFQEIIQDFL